MHKIDVEPEHLQIIRDILKRYLPASARVWVFGSRITGTAKKYSDIDLLIDMNKMMPLELTANLSHDFEESSLPYKVDVVDWHNISEAFQRNIVNKIPLDFFK